MISGSTKFSLSRKNQLLLGKYIGLTPTHVYSDWFLHLQTASLFSAVERAAGTQYLRTELNNTYN